MTEKIREKYEWDFDQLQQTAEEKEQCSWCYANPRAEAYVYLQDVCVQPRRQMHACGKTLQ